jgi:thioredoxin-related protein
MGKKLITLLIIGLFTLLHAQSAPDFITTDANGKKHHLYGYLESGKYVLLGFFTEW